MCFCLKTIKTYEHLLLVLRGSSFSAVSCYVAIYVFIFFFFCEAVGVTRVVEASNVINDPKCNKGAKRNTFWA